MNELDREMILAQRGEERDAAIERRRNAKMAAQAQQAAAAVSAPLMPRQGLIRLHLFLGAPVNQRDCFANSRAYGIAMQPSSWCEMRGACVRGREPALNGNAGSRADAVVDAGEAAGPRQEGRAGGAPGRAPEEDPAQRVTAQLLCNSSCSCRHLPVISVSLRQLCASPTLRTCRA